MKSSLYHTSWAGVWLSVAMLAVSVVGSWVLCSTEAHAQERPAQSTQRGWLGIVMDEKPGGRVLVKQVLRGSPAEKARLRPGDTVLRIHGTTVRSARETAAAVGKHTAGTVVHIAISRNGSERVIPIRLDPFPSGEELLRKQLVGRPAPPLQALRSLANSQGPTLNDFRGKVLVIDFWASFCIACRVTSMQLNQWHQRYANHGLDVLGIAAEPPDSATRGARRFGIQYPTSADPDMSTSIAYHVNELPSLIVVDRRGIVRDVTTGHDPARLREMESLVQRLLAEPVPFPTVNPGRDPRRVQPPP